MEIVIFTSMIRYIYNNNSWGFLNFFVYYHRGKIKRYVEHLVSGDKALDKIRRNEQFQLLLLLYRLRETPWLRNLR